MRIGIAGIVCEVDGLTGGFAASARDRYAAFLTGEDAQFKLSLRVEQLTGRNIDDDRERVIDVWREGPIVHATRPDNPFRARLDLERNAGQATLSPNLYCLDSLLRITWSVLLGETGGLLLHSCAVMHDGLVTVLAGQSEAGKTTLSRLGFETVLSDELVALRCAPDGEATAYGTPFWGEFVGGRENSSGPVGSVYLLRKGPVNAVTPVDRVQALRELLGCTFFFGPPDLTASVLDTCTRLASTKLAGELHVFPTPEVVSFIRGEESRNAS